MAGALVLQAWLGLAYTASYSSVRFDGLPALRTRCVDGEPALAG